AGRADALRPCGDRRPPGGVHDGDRPGRLGHPRPGVHRRRPHRLHRLRRHRGALPRGEGLAGRDAADVLGDAAPHRPEAGHDRRGRGARPRVLLQPDGDGPRGRHDVAPRHRRRLRALAGPHRRGVAEPPAGRGAAVGPSLGL
ncbi:MAG: hypothetical protein AVDCRST_MAG47-261, partial [uncultured Nocardioidaceae bacterium]